MEGELKNHKPQLFRRYLNSHLLKQ